MSKVSDDHFSFSGQFAVISDIETFFKSKGIPAEVQEIIRAAEPPKTKKEKTKRVTTDNLSIKGSLVKVAKTFIEYLWSLGQIDNAPTPYEWLSQLFPL